MTSQITVDLPTRQVEFLDRLVRDGEFSTRAAAVSDALRRDQRRRRGEQDAIICVRFGQDSDLAGLADWQVAHADLGRLDWAARSDREPGQGPSAHSP